MQHLGGDLRAVVHGVGGGQDEAELVAAEARHRVFGAHAALQALRHLAQQQVTCRVAVQVVHGLEAIEIQVEHGGAPAMAARRVEHLRKAVLEQQPVGQASEGVVARIVGQACLQVLARGDVLHHGHQQVRRAACAPNHAQRLADPQGRAVLAQVGLLDLWRERVGVVGQAFGQELARGLTGRPLAQVEQAARAQLFAGVAQHVAVLLVGAQDVSLRCDVHDAHGRLVEGGAEQRFVGMQGARHAALACQRPQQQPSAADQRRRGAASDGEVAGAALLRRRHGLRIGRAHREHQGVVAHGAVADDARHAVTGLAAVYEAAFGNGGLALHPGHGVRRHAEAGLSSGFAGAHHAVKPADFQQALGAQAPLAVEVGEVRGVDRHDDNPAEAAVRARDAQ